MTHRYPLLMSLLTTAAGASAPALAQWRCDCTSVVDSCEADVAISGNTVQITSDSPQCSRVDYFIDGQPFVSLVVDGEHREDWIAQTEAPRILVQSCQVCTDNGASPIAPSQTQAAQQQPNPETEEREGELTPLIQVPPTYPAAALPGAVQGHVDVEITVDEQGTVQNPRVTAAEPAGVFDQAALTAVSRWRYPAEPGREPQALTERVEFRPPADTAAAPGPVPPQNGTQQVRNQCVREGSVYNYGTMIEVGLLNACEAPIMVFGCAGGTDAHQGRWVCTTPEEQRSLLVPAGDPRLGSSISIGTPEGVLPLTYSDRFFVSRAPNTEYWWLACAVDDMDCLAAARQWTRSVDGQLASVDPRGRSSVEVARSH